MNAQQTSPHTAEERERWIEANAAGVDVIRDEATGEACGYGVRVHTDRTGWMAAAPTFADAVDLAMAATAGGGE